MIFALAAALLASSFEPSLQISHERIGENAFRLRLQAPGITEVADGQRHLLPTAQRLCGSLPLNYGRYRWEGLERLENAGTARQPISLTLYQDISCDEAAAPAPAIAADPSPDWQPSTADEQAVLAASTRYFEAKDSGRYADAWAMLAPESQSISPLPGWSEAAGAFNSEAGTVRARDLFRLTWYNNPPSAPVPGIYAAVDFNGEFENLHFLCGFVIWLLQPDGSWRLVREEQYLASRTSASDATPEDLAPLRQQIGCRD